MIPRVAKSGRSFKGAALYYLHDKKADTSDRVAFVETLNLPTNDAQRAVAHMIDTATHAAELKQAAGLNSGRKLEKPVYSYSLAWHPSEAPTQAEQVAAARETIAALGLSGHQALIVSHNDTDHPHVHVIINRVCPETGRAAVMSKDQIILSDWARKYQEQRGQKFTPQRDINHAIRNQGQWKKDDSLSRKEWYEWKKAQSDELWNDYRTQKAKANGSRKSQLDALWQQKESRIKTRRLEVKARFKPQWREKFKAQRQELGNFDHGVIDRIGFALSQKKGMVGVLEAVIAPGGLRHELIAKQEKERKVLAYAQGIATRDASKEVTKAWKYDRDQLYKMWNEQDADRLREAKLESAKIWDKEKSRGGAANDFGKAKENSKSTIKDFNRKKGFLDRVKEQSTNEELNQAKRAKRKRARRERKSGRDFKPD